MTKKRIIQVPLSAEDESGTVAYRHHRGVIKDNAIQALLHDPLFRQRIEKKRKGKGSYQRKAKHAVKYFEKPDYQVFDDRNLIIGLFMHYNKPSSQTQ